MNILKGGFQWTIFFTYDMGRLKARELEDEHMDTFELEKGRPPRENLKRNRKK